MLSRRRATSPHPRVAKSRASLTAPHNTQPCPALLLQRYSELHHVRGIKGCHSVWLCLAVEVIHSGFTQTGLCVHLTGAGLLNQRGERTHTGTGADILLIQARLGVYQKVFNAYRLSDEHCVCSSACITRAARHGPLFMSETISFVSSVSAPALERYAIPET